jgi:hypothetical protein
VFCYLQRRPSTAETVFMARSLIDIGALDALLQEALSKVASTRDFQVTVWRQEPDATGCNWDARFERISRTDSADKRWWKVVPEFRTRFNVATVTP